MVNGKKTEPAGCRVIKTICAIKPAISTIEQTLVLKKLGRLSSILKELLDLKTK